MSRLVYAYISLAGNDSKSENESPMARESKLLRHIGGLILNCFVAVGVTATLEMPIYRSLRYLFHPRTIRAVLLREYLLSIVIASLLGFLIYRMWKPETSKWVWVIGLALFTARALSLVLYSPGSAWLQMSGGACIAGVRAMGCMNYFDFTIPAVRAICYSIGAWLGWYLGYSGAPFVLESVLADFRNPFLASESEDPTANS